MQFSENSPAKLRFKGIDIVEVQFVAQRPFDQTTLIDLDVTPQVFYPEDEPTVFRLFMGVRLHAEEFFTFNLRAIGHFEFSEELNSVDRKAMVDRNAPAIMYPYIRAAVATISSSLGESLGTLHIPARFFSGEVPEIVSSPNQEQLTQQTISVSSPVKRLRKPKA